MHFVCSLYASLNAYIFVPSALRTRLFSFLYALYAVNSGVVFSHSMHSRFFDAYNAYRLHGWQSAVTAERGGDPNPDKRAMRPDGVHKCTESASSEEMIARKSRTVEDKRTDNIKKK